jgi:hypothetical protein
VILDDARDRVVAAFRGRGGGGGAAATVPPAPREPAGHELEPALQGD